MKRTTILIALFVTAGISQAAEVAPRPDATAGTAVTLAYRHEERTVGGMAVANFEVTTNRGILKGVFENYREDGIRARFGVLGTNSSLELTAVTNTPGSPVLVLQYDFGPLGTMIYALDATAGTVTLLGHTVQDCAALADSPVLVALTDALSRLLGRIALDDSVPDHDALFAGGMFLATAGPRLLSDCWNPAVVLSGPCDYFQPDYDACRVCCRNEQKGKNLLKLTLAGAGRLVPLLFWGGVAFAALDELGGGLEGCYDSACHGKSGDPSCDPTQNCEGVCQGACLGLKHGCGKCDDELRIECCRNP